MSDIDNEAVINQLQRELEVARLTILKMRYSHRPFLFSASDVRKTVNDNYLVIIGACMVLPLVWDFIESLTGSILKHRSKHDA